MPLTEQILVAQSLSLCQNKSYCSATSLLGKMKGKREVKQVWEEGWDMKYICRVMSRTDITKAGESLQALWAGLLELVISLVILALSYWQFSPSYIKLVYTISCRVPNVSCSLIRRWEEIMIVPLLKTIVYLTNPSNKRSATGSHLFTVNSISFYWIFTLHYVEDLLCMLVSEVHQMSGKSTFSQGQSRKS